MVRNLLCKTMAIKMIPVGAGEMLPPRQVQGTRREKAGIDTETATRRSDAAAVLAMPRTPFASDQIPGHKPLS
jgi:hypothetical protein